MADDDQGTGPFPFSSHFAHLTRDDLALPIRVTDTFWEQDIGNLPPGKLVSLLTSNTPLDIMGASSRR